MTEVEDPSKGKGVEGGELRYNGARVQEAEPPLLSTGVERRDLDPGVYEDRGQGYKGVVREKTLTFKQNREARGG